MSNSTFSNGRGYISLTPYRTAPEERIRVTISDNFVTGAEGLRLLAAYLRDQSQHLEADDLPPLSSLPKEDQEAVSAVLDDDKPFEAPAPVKVAAKKPKRKAAATASIPQE